MRSAEYESDEQAPYEPKPFDEELPRRIIVKFKEKVIQLPYEDHAERFFDEKMRQRWEKLKEAYPDITLQRVFISVEPTKIQELTERAIGLDPTYEPTDFLTFFMIELDPGINPNPLVEALKAWDIVEYAYVESLPAPSPSLPAGTNPSLPDRHYLEPPQHTNPSSTHIGGIDALFVWGNFGATTNAGHGIRFIDIEKGWNLNHQDLAAASITLVGGISRDEPRHGTNVLGILAAQDNSWGGVGIAYKSTGRVISGWANITDSLPRWHDGIMNAANNLSFGDVLLLEAQIWPAGVEIPLELESTNFAVIRLATALGITVIQAAGNGGQLLDNQVDNNGLHILNIASSEFRDSGAILVGAANSFSHNATRRPSSNFGSRVNCFAWGTNVYTTDTDVTGTNNTLPDRRDFSATSAASAIIAGAALLLQGIAKEPSPTGLGFRLNPYQLRNILGDTTPGTNTPSDDPSTDKIGVMPNLRNIINNLGVINNRKPDLVVRDNLADTGEPHTGLLSISPDIIVRPENTVTNPQASFGGGSPNIMNGNLSHDQIQYQDQDIFVRVFNRGGANATNAQATVYWAPPTTLVTPNMWNLIGTSAPLTSAIVPNTSSMTVLNRINWDSSSSSFPGQGHYCFIAVVFSSEDTNPIPDHTQLTRTLTFDQFLDLIRTNNNITWDNFEVLPILSSASMMMKFIAPGAYDDDRLMQLEIVAHLPEGAQLSLEGPANFVNALQKGYFENVREERMRVLLSPYGVNRYKEIMFPANSQNQLELIADIPEAQCTRNHEVYVRHLYNGEEIGRITWQLVLPAEKDRFSLIDILRKLFASLSPLNCLLLLFLALALLIILILVLIR